MALSIPEVQRALVEDGLDGWLLYDFQGSNPIAGQLSGLASAGLTTTRRWFYLIPAAGAPQGLVHAIERHTLDQLPGTKRPYAGRDRLAAGLRDLLRGMRRVAMEYSPGNNIPYISRVDAGTMEAVRDLGVEVVSSGDLVQRFEAVWSAEALATHRQASEALHRIKDQAFDLVRERIAANAPVNEHDVQRAMMSWMEGAGLVGEGTPNVSAQENAGNPHYYPSDEVHREIRPHELLLIDVWGKLRAPGAVFADITWVAFTGDTVPDEYARAFAAARDGRDAAVALVQAAARDGRELRGFEVDRTCRAVLDARGYGDAFIHRTGHSLGARVHGNGVHLDDYETHDDRRLIAGAGFTVEPGVYTDRFGVRTEINMYMDEQDAYVTGPLQQELVRLV
jgi:Xaa-Pro dipeptidase